MDLLQTRTEEDLWLRLTENAARYRRSDREFVSRVRGNRYRVEAITPERLTITRLDGNESVTLARGQVIRAVQAIGDAGGRARRGSILTTVAQETALVELHPELTWDDSNEWIIRVREKEFNRPLTLYEDYSRHEVHDIFAPETRFTPQAGTWGLQGIVPIPDRTGDFVFFVTYGKRQGEHLFAEGITADGVLTWQSQPSQSLANAQIQRFITHDDERNSIHLFLRTRAGADYTYLGRLRYLTHDLERERPVHFQWQVLPEIIPPPIAARIGLEFERSAPAPDAQQRHGLIQVPVPTSSRRTGQSSRAFRGQKQADYADRDARNRELGLAGEFLVLAWERAGLRASGREDLAARVRHTSVLEGDGAGYDIKSFTEDGSHKYIEVKTTRGRAATPFYMTANELAFAAAHADRYSLYRLFEVDVEQQNGSLYIVDGNPVTRLDLTATEYRVRLPCTP